MRSSLERSLSKQSNASSTIRLGLRRVGLGYCTSRLASVLWGGVGGKAAGKCAKRAARSRRAHMHQISNIHSQIPNAVFQNGSRIWIPFLRIQIRNNNMEYHTPETTMS